MERIGKRRFSTLRRRGGALGVVLVILALIGAIGGGVYWRAAHSKTSKQTNLIFATVERGTFVHEVNGKGSAESAKNIDVASQVEGSATVIYLIDEGTDVKKGDLLVELDSSDIDEKLDSQVVTTNSSRATLNNSRATLRSAEISLEEYVEGTFEQSWMEYASTIFDNEQTRKQKADITRFTERLLNLDYSTELQYEIDKVAEENAKNTLEVTNLKKMTLLKYTSEKQITSLMSDIETARAKVDSDKNSYNINLSRENRYREQSANCKIRAPQDGQVVYANQDSRRMSEADMIKEGSTVRQRQVLIRLPDKTQMQVKTMINESNISAVKVGMPAKITFDSMPNRVVEGEVTKVNLYPEIVWMSSAKDYVTLVKIKDDIPELRSGLTAQVRIVAVEKPDVLMVPVQCVTEFGSKTYCLTFNDGVWGYKEVLLGDSNEKQVIILDGLEEGDKVVSGARLYRDNVVFPGVDEPSKFEDSEIYQNKIAERKEEEAKQKEIEAEAVNGAAPGGFPGGGGLPGGLPAGVDVAALAQRFANGGGGGLPAGVDLAELAKRFGGGFPGARGGGDSDGQAKNEEEALELHETIEERLARDAKIARIEPFFTRTVMEMQRELLAAISDKTSDLSSSIAEREAKITSLQDEIERLQNPSAFESLVQTQDEDETVEQKTARLIDEIKALRGDSDKDPLERVSYYEQIDWSKYVSGNDITRDGLNFLLEDSSAIFDRLFPNSKPIEEPKTGSEGASDDEEDFELLKREENEKYAAFMPLFDLWDSNADGRLKPTEFVIGFFSDRKSFQDSETDDDSDKLFAEYRSEEEPEANEISFDRVAEVADKILRERADSGSGKSGRRGGGRGGRPGGEGRGAFGGRGDFGGQTPPSPGSETAKDAAPDAPEGTKPELPNGAPSFDLVVGEVPEGFPGAQPAPSEPISTLVEAGSLRQAMALYVSQMDFNEDGLLQKQEFVKGYNDVKDVAGKLFASGGGSGGGAGGGMGGGPMGPPPM